MEIPQQARANWKYFHELFSTAFIHEALGTAAELEIADAVGEEPASARYIATILNLHEGSVYRLLRALAAYGIFEETAEGEFRHNSFSRQLSKKHPYSLHAMAKLWHSDALRMAWGKFPDALRDGRSAFQHAHGENIYHFLESHSETAGVFHQAMENNSTAVAESLAAGFPFGNYPRILDLGGGMGSFLAAILKAHPLNQGAVYDLPVVAEAFQKYIDSQKLKVRARFISGDWFESVPADFDLYLVKNSLWNWPDAECGKILKNVRQAMRANSELLIIEYFPQADKPWTTAFDLQQLNVTGGRGRTPEEYRRLLEEVGLTLSASFQIETQAVLQCRPRVDSE